MHLHVFILSVLLLLTSTANAADQYAFHIRVTDGRSGLLANPDYEQLKISPDQLERAAQDRVVVLDDASGTRWRWLMLSWFADDPKVEQGIFDRGGAKPEQADFALLSGTTGHFRVRCLREACRIEVTGGDGKAVSADLKRGEVSGDLPLDSRLTFR
jgi:hypothetical protein